MIMHWECLTHIASVSLLQWSQGTGVWGLVRKIEFVVDKVVRENVCGAQ